MKCKYWDCGWCYAKAEVETNAIAGQCQDPKSCKQSIASVDKFSQHKVDMAGKDAEIDRLRGQLRFAVKQSKAVTDELEDAQKEIDELKSEKEMLREALGRVVKTGSIVDIDIIAHKALAATEEV